MHGGGRHFAPPDVRSQGYATIFARWPLQTPLPAPEGVVPKKLKALIQVCFSGQTVEVGLGLFSLITLWANDHYAKHAPTVRVASWYRKSLPTFSDALAAVRRQLWTQGNLQGSRQGIDPAKICPSTLNILIDMACYAA